MDFSGKQFPKEVIIMVVRCDKDGNTINFHFSETRDHQAALICIHGAMRIARFIPDKINSDGSPANELAVRISNQEHQVQDLLTRPEFCGPLEPTVKYTKVKYCNNIIEQDHRRVKKITNPMLGLKEFNTAANTIDGIEAIAMLRKNQCVFSKLNGRVLSIADQINLLAA